MSGLYLCRRGELMERGQPGYVFGVLPKNGISRRWLWRGVERSVQWRGNGGGVVKLADGFDSHTDTREQFAALLAESAARGVPHPSSYASLLDAEMRLPSIRAWAAKQFRGAVPGGWVKTLTTNPRVTRPLRQYDIRSAYLWSLRQGLPHPDSFRLVRGYAGHGVYWVISPNRAGYPHPWNREGVFPAPSEEIEYLCLRSHVTERGVAYEPGSFDVSHIDRRINSWPTAWKEIARSFWGRWGSADGPTCQTLDTADMVRTSRELRPRWTCPAWAVIITSRVRVRLAELYARSGSDGMQLVQTDSVTVDADFHLPTGERVGDWRLVRDLPQGGYITTGGILPVDWSLAGARRRDRIPAPMPDDDGIGEWLRKVG